MATFTKLYDQLATELAKTGASDRLSVQFKKLSTEKDRIAFILKADDVTGIIDKWSYNGPSSSKSSTTSENIRLQGNALFKKRNFSAALEKYTESIFFAECSPKNSPCLAMGLANRSAALFQTNSFQDARKDAEMAISCGYPEKLMHKLLERIGKCYMKEKQFAIGKRYFRDAFLSLTKSELTVDRKNDLAFHYHELETLCTTSKEEINIRESIEKFQYETKIEKQNCNTVYLSATSAFSIVSNNEFGRHAVATRDIDAGELIIFEKAFCSVLFKENRLTHCYHCLTRCKTLIGCFSCNFIGFCSEDCRNFAWKKYHKIECSFITTMYAAETGFGHLALQTVLSAGLDYLLSFDSKFTEGQTGLNDDGVYDSMSYLSVHSLIGHSESRPLSDLFRKSVLAVFLLKFIDNDDFFTAELAEESLFKKKVCIGSHILKQLQMLPCNAHEVSELQIERSSIADSELKEIGSAIYATLSLLNHSCNPSVVRHSYGSSCALRTIRKIPKGGMIVDNYGALYAVSKLVDRQNLVSSQYYFSCNCEACLNDWPLYDQLPNKSPQLKCPECDHLIDASNWPAKHICPSCKSKLPASFEEFSESRTKFAVAMNAVLEGSDPKEQLPNLLKHLQLISELVKLPWQEFNNCQEIVKQCFGMLANHYYCES